MAQLESDREDRLYTFSNTWIRCCPGKTNIRIIRCCPGKPKHIMHMHIVDICILIFIWQLYSPAKAIFIGIGTLLLVRILNKQG